MTWLDAQANGIALALWVLCGLLCALLLALGIEAYLARGMRKRRREREALIHYCNTIEAQL